MSNKSLYEVKRGDSYLAIAARHETTLDLLVYLNGLMDLRSLQPKDELIVMPLNLKFLIDPNKKVLSLWDGERFLKEYSLLAVEGVEGELVSVADSLLPTGKARGGTGIDCDRVRSPLPPPDRRASAELSHTRGC